LNTVRKSYRVGIVSNTAAVVLGRLCTLLAGVILAKVLGRALFGRYFSDQALALVGAGIYNLGLGEGFRQVASRTSANRAALLWPTVKLRAAAIVAYALVMAAYLVYRHEMCMETIIVVLAVLLMSLTEIASIDMMVRQDYVSTFVMNTGKGVILLVPALLCWASHGSYRVFIMSYAIGALILTSYGLINVRASLDEGGDNGDVRIVLKASAPYILSIGAFAFTNNWGVNVIRSQLGNADAGTYLVPWKIYQVVLLVGMVTASVALPLYHRLDHLHDDETYENIYRRVIRGMVVVAGLVIGVCTLMPEDIVRILATREYAGAAALFPLLAMSVSFRIMSIPAENLLESIGRQRFRISILVSGAVLCFVMFRYLVPGHGVLGGAIAMLCVDGWLMLALWFTAWVMKGNVVKPLYPLKHVAVIIILLFGVKLLPGGRIPGFLRTALFSLFWCIYAIFVMKIHREIRGMTSLTASGSV